MTNKFKGELFIDTLRHLRAGKTQEDFSKELGISRATLSLYETGKQLPKNDFLVKICNLSSQTVASFFEKEHTDGLIYMMGELDQEEEKAKLEELKEVIWIKEKYHALSKRC